MNKKCGKCAKTVYPTEELKCLDKSWHKGCFRCWECGMALNMRTYKGINKLPYCEAHIPKPKATTVADTPEMARIAENTKIQSNVKYHADFEAAKGKFTTVADDPETLRIKANTKIISNVAYHGDLEKKAAMDQQRQLTGENGDPAAPPPPASSGRHERAPPPASSAPPPAAAAPASHPQAARLSNNNYGGGGGGTPHSARTQQASTLIYTSQLGAEPPPANVVYIWPQQMNSQPQQRVGSIQEYDPINEQYGSSAGRYNPPQHQPQQYQPPQHQQYRQPQQQQQQYHPPQQQYHPPQQQQYPPQQYAGYQQQQQQHQQPQYGGYRQDHGGYRSQQVYRTEQPPQQQQHQQQHRSHQQPAPAPQAHQPPPSGRCCRALYDYEAADTDEISFREGDLMVGCQPIDDGWMTGTCQRSGQRGMLPANYVEPVDL